jgi:hypothetical protein
MRLTKDNDLIQALATQRTDQPFRYTILPWRPRRNRPVTDTHRPEPRHQRQEGTKALQEYRAKQEAIRNLTAKLRAERLAREAINGKPKSERKKATRA